MADVESAVRGGSLLTAMPEVAHVRAGVGSLSADPAESYDLVVANTSRIAAAVKRRYDAEAGPVLAWSTQSVQTRVDRDRGHRRLPPAYHASVRIDVTFSDFREVSTWLAECAEIDGFNVEGMSWDLREARRQELLAQLRGESVQDARHKAQQYADGLGLGPVQVRAVADQGMLPDLPGRRTAHGTVAPRAAAGTVEPDMELRPEEIELFAQVEARSVADGGA